MWIDNSNGAEEEEAKWLALWKFYPIEVAGPYLEAAITKSEKERRNKRRCEE